MDTDTALLNIAPSTTENEQSQSDATAPLILSASKSSQLMTGIPVSIASSMKIKDAAVFLLDSGIHAAPVIDSAGRPVGVLSLTDIARYECERLNPPVSSFRVGRTSSLSEAVPAATDTETTPPAEVSQIMTPIICTVTTETLTRNVIQEMLKRHIHQIFIVDEQRVLVGEISTWDILKKLIE